MTPKEQIEKQAEEYAWVGDIFDLTATYKTGAEYGYNLAIKNMVELLKKDLIETKDRDGHPSIESSSCRTVDEFINDIKQAMKL